MFHVERRAAFHVERLVAPDRIFADVPRGTFLWKFWPDPAATASLLNAMMPFPPLHQNTSLQSRFASAYSANISGFSKI